MLDGYPTTELLNVVFNRFTEYEAELTHLRAENAVLTDKLARMTNEVLKVRAHLSTGGKYAIEREDKTTMGVGEELMWSDIFEKIDALLPPYED